MPEGDSIYLLAARLHHALAGASVQSIETDRAHLARASLMGATIDRVHARGKYLIVEFVDGRRLFSHQKMNGRWRVLPSDRTPRWGPGFRLALVTDRGILLGTGAPRIELCRPGETPAALQRLGPDLLADDFDIATAVERLQAQPGLEIGAALMRQELVAGIGNVYKSEVLFCEQVDPFRRVDDLSTDSARALLKRAQHLMKKNLRPGPRATRARGGGRLWVYGRSGDPCYRCGAYIRMKRQGYPPRSTYFCSDCQS